MWMRERKGTREIFCLGIDTDFDMHLGTNYLVRETRN